MTLEKVVSKEDQVYRALQIHLDNQAVGYPAVESGADLRVLKHVFTPEEAQIVLYLVYKYENIDQIYEKAKESGISKEDLEEILEKMVEKGSIGYKERDGIGLYHSKPLVVGFYEGMVYNLTREFLADMEEYTSDPVFGKFFINSKPIQMRTIPIEKSITPEHNVATYEQVEEIIKNLDGPIVVVECICRQKTHLLEEKCKVTSRLETCMGFGDAAKIGIKYNIGRQINKEEALEILRKNQEDGLVLQPSNSQEAEFICSCCGCCCGMLGAHQKIPKPLDLWASNYYANIDPDLCIGCQTCVERCQVKAIRFRKSKNISQVKMDLCIGCGNCVVVCPEEAIKLEKREIEIIPPKTIDDLYETIKSNR